MTKRLFDASSSSKSIDELEKELEEYVGGKEENVVNNNNNGGGGGISHEIDDDDYEESEIARVKLSRKSLNFKSKTFKIDPETYVSENFKDLEREYKEVLDLNILDEEYFDLIFTLIDSPETERKKMFFNLLLFLYKTKYEKLFLKIKNYLYFLFAMIVYNSEKTFLDEFRLKSLRYSDSKNINMPKLNGVLDKLKKKKLYHQSSTTTMTTTTTAAAAAAVTTASTVFAAIADDDDNCSSKYGYIGKFLHGNLKKHPLLKTEFFKKYGCLFKLEPFIEKCIPPEYCVFESKFTFDLVKKHYKKDGGAEKEQSSLSFDGLAIKLKKTAVCKLAVVKPNNTYSIKHILECDNLKSTIEDCLAYSMNPSPFSLGACSAGFDIKNGRNQPPDFQNPDASYYFVFADNFNCILNNFSRIDSKSYVNKIYFFDADEIITDDTELSINPIKEKEEILIKYYSDLASTTTENNSSSS